MNQLFYEAKPEKRFFAAYALIILFLNLFCHFPELISRYLIYPDLCYAYVLYQFQDSSLFRADLFAQALAGMSAHYNFFFKKAVVFLLERSPLETIFKLVSIFQGIATGILVYFLCKKSFGSKFAFFFGIIFNTYALTTNLFYGGLSRGWSLLITSAFFCFLLLKKYDHMIVAVLLTILFYPVSAPALILICLIAVFWNQAERKARAVNFLKLAGVIILFSAYVFLFWRHYPLMVCEIEKIMNYRYGEISPLLHDRSVDLETRYHSRRPYGVQDVIFNFMLNFNEHRTEMFVVLTILFILSGTFIFIASQKFRKEFSTRAWIFLSAHLAMFGVTSMFSLSIASKMLTVSLPVFFAFYFSAAIYHHFKRFPRPLILHAINAGFIIGLILFCPHNNVEDYRRHKPLYEYIRTLPADSLIAGTPEMLETVPLFTKKTVYYINCFVPDAKTYEKMIDRQLQMNTALYADSLAGLAEFLKNSGVTHLVIDANYFGDIVVRGRIDMFSAYEFEIQKIIENFNPRREIKMLKLFERLAVFESRDVLVVESRCIIAAVGGPESGGGFFRYHTKKSL